MPLPTIADVASAAGVSKATVSRVLSGDFQYIREETRQRVQQAIDELGYRPSGVARSLTSKRTQTIGMLISDVGNPFYADVIHGVEDKAIEQSYSVLLGNTNYSLERGMALVKSFIDRRVDGVLIMSSIMSDDWLEELNHNQIPTVAIDWEVKAAQGHASAIGVDFRGGIRAAVDYLIQLGHRRFAHISGPLHLQTARNRRDAFLEALGKYGIGRDEVPVIESSLRIEGGREAGPALLALTERPTAVFTANDLIAIGLLSSLQSGGARVPRDISVVGLDDVWLAAQSEPPLTTVALPRYEIGLMAVQTLFKLLNVPKGESQGPIYTRVETSLVVRESTGPVKSDGSEGG